MTLRDKLKFWILLSSYVEMIVRGTSPLSLSSAVANSLDYVKAFGGTEQRNLPSGYTQVEYLQSRGTQYINTDIPVSDDLTFGYKVSSYIANQLSISQLQPTPLGRSGLIVWQSGNKINIRYMSDGAQFTKDTGVMYALNQVFDFIFNDNNNFYINGVLNYTKTNTIDTSGVLVTGLHDTVYSLWAKIDGVLVFNGIPCRRNSDSVLGMYDTVSGTFFTNAGTGDFTAGPDAVPTPDAPMDIVSNNGALKVNTNLYSTEYHDVALSQSDGVTVSSNAGVDVSAMINCTNTKSFMVTSATPTGSYRLFQYGPDGTFMNAGAVRNFGEVLQLPSDCGYFRIQYNYTMVGTNTENILIYDSAYGLNEVYADGTVETVTVTGKNLLDMANANIHAGYIGSSINQPIVWSVSSVTNTIVNAVSVKAGETYTFSFFNNVNGSLNIHIINNGIVLQRTTYNITANQRISASISATVDGQLYIQYVISGQDFQLEKGSTTTEYEPYFNGGSANAEMLLQVGNYKDEQEVLSGGITRNIGIKVLDGTESWTAQGGTRPWGYAYSLDTPLQDAMAGIDTKCYSTHFKAVSKCWDTATGPCFSFHQAAIPTWKGKPFFVVEQDTAEKFNQWLADQYNAGTPVTIVYPLATPTTESVAGQTLQVQAGDNIVEITQASLDGLELEAKYKKQA